MCRPSLMSGRALGVKLALLARKVCHRILDAACRRACRCTHVTSATPTGQWRPDPRTGELGQRALLPKSADPTLEAAAATADEAAYRQWRIEHGVAEGGTEIPSGQHPFPLPV